MVTPLGLGPRTPKLKAWCSDQLSYGAIYPFDAAKEIWPTAVFFRSKKNLHFFFKKHLFFSKRIRKMPLFSS